MYNQRDLRLLLTDGELDITKLAEIYEMQRFYFVFVFNFFQLFELL